MSCPEHRLRARAALVVAALLVALLVTSPAAAASWTGTWTTSFGEMTLTETVDPATGGRSVSGRYTWAPSPGAITGTASGDVLTGTWREDTVRTAPGFGPIVFTMSADGRAFTGVWAPDGQAPTQPWNGTRVGAPPPEATPTPTTPAPVPPPRYLGPLAPYRPSGGNDMSGYWKLRGSSTSAIFRATRRGLVGGRLPDAIRGRTPVVTANLSRPGGCYRRVGRLEWVIGGFGAGDWLRYVPRSGCRRSQRIPARWFLNGPNGLRQRYTVDPDGPSGPTPGRTAQLFWERTRPLLVIERPRFTVGDRRFLVGFRTAAHFDHLVELVRDGRVVGTARTPVRDGRWLVTFDGASAAPGPYTVRVHARDGALRRRAELPFRLDDDLAVASVG